MNRNKEYILILPNKIARNEEFYNALTRWYININSGTSLGKFIPYDEKNMFVDVSGINWSNWTLAINNLKYLPYTVGMPKIDWKGKLEEKMDEKGKSKRNPLVYELLFDADCYKEIFKVTLEEIEDDKAEKEENIKIFKRTVYIDSSDDEKSNGCDKDCM